MKIQQFIKALKEKRVYEAFGAGTAAVISPVESIRFKDDKYEIPLDKEKGIGELSLRIKNTIIDLQHGKIKRPEWQIKVC